MKRMLVIAAVMIAAAGCSSGQVNTAKMNPLFTNSAPGTFPAGAKFTKVSSWAVGQWITMGSIEEGKKKSVMKMSIVGKSEGGFIIEVQSFDSERDSVFQYLVKGIDTAQKTGNASSIEIVWIKIKDENGAIQKFDGALMQMYKSMAPNFADSVKSVTTYTNGGPVTVPAGTFAATNAVKTETKVMGFTSKSTGYFHSSVPINGMVKSVSDDGKTETVLIAFGTSGAKPVIPLD